MWLIEYSEGNFVDARKIEFFSVVRGKAKFWTVSGSQHEVHDDYIASFLNQYQTLNANPVNVEQRYYQLKEKGVQA